jgi:hypothetical protein
MEPEGIPPESLVSKGIKAKDLPSFLKLQFRLDVDGIMGLQRGDVFRSRRNLRSSGGKSGISEGGRAENNEDLQKCIHVFLLGDVLKGVFRRGEIFVPIIPHLALSLNSRPK